MTCKITIYVHTSYKANLGGVLVVCMTKLAVCYGK